MYQPRKEEIVQQFMQALDNHFADLLQKRTNKMFHMKDFAAVLHIHPNYLSNIVKGQTSKSPCDFIEERIMAEAKRMLTETNLTIAQIADLLTFTEATNFTKFFKKFTGLTPKEFRGQLVQS